MAAGRWRVADGPEGAGSTATRRYNHLRSWGVKAFFTAFMVPIVPPGFGEDFIRGDTSPGAARSGRAGEAG